MGAVELQALQELTVLIRYLQLLLRQAVARGAPEIALLVVQAARAAVVQVVRREQLAALEQLRKVERAVQGLQAQAIGRVVVVVVLEWLAQTPLLHTAATAEMV